MIEDFQGSMTFEDIVDKYTIPQLTIMRLDKPSVEYDDDYENKEIDTAHDFFNAINR